MPAPTLVIPARSDAERDAVAEVWRATGHDVLRLDRFWEPPPLDPARVRLYGNDTFCLVLAEILGLELVSPPEDVLLGLGRSLLGRDLGSVALADVRAVEFPRFVKPLVPKQFPARVYGDAAELHEAARGLPAATNVIHAEPVTFAAEARVFVLDGEAVACGLYAGDAALAGAGAAAEAVAAVEGLPRTFVVDVGRLRGAWVVVETNATWGAGLNGCDPAAVVPCIDAATRPLDPG